MATKKPAAKSTVKTNARSGSKTPAGRSRKAPQTAHRRPARPKPELARSWSILLFCQGLIFLAMAFIPGQSLWHAVRQFLFGVFGVSAYTLGLFVLYWAVLVALEQPILQRVLKDVTLIAFFSGTLVVFSKFNFDGHGFGEAVMALYENGQNALLGGGVIGGIFGGSMLALCGRPGANVILLILLAAAVMVAAGVTPGDLWQIADGWVGERRDRREERLQQRYEQMQLEEARQAQQEYQEKKSARPEPVRPRSKPVLAPPAGLRRRHAVDIDLGPDPVAETDTAIAPVPEEPIIGPGGTFGMMRPRKPAPEPEPVQPPVEEIPSAEVVMPEEPEEDVFETPISLEHTDDELEEATEPELADLIQKAMTPSESAEPALVVDKNDQMMISGADDPVPEVYQFPPLELLQRSEGGDDPGAQEELRHNADLLVKTLDSFGVRTRVLDICRGPTVTRYELQPQAGVKISRITNLSDDIALNLATAGVRIEAPIPGKPAVGIEVPNRIKSPVGMRGVLESQAYQNNKSALPLTLGKDIAGAVQVADLCKMPHLLIAGSTGSGKSVCVNSIIMGFLYNASPDDVKLILIDPKVVELAEYNGIPHLLMPVVTEPRKAAGALGSAVAEMERRYHLFAENNVRDIKSFNRMAEGDETLEKLPYIAIIIDELADLMMVAGKEVEDYICRIAQKARAAGMHLIVATQRPSVDVITGLIKANIPSRIAFAVSSQVDSRTILDSGGAEKLLGMGDMLFLPVGAAKPVRIQGTFVKDEEISAVLDFIKKGSSAQYNEAMIAEMEKRAVPEKAADGSSDGGEAHDPMLKQAAETVIDAGLASTSLLQRRCKLGYARAARIMDEMEAMGIIGPYQGAKPREVLVSRQQWIEMCMNDNEPVPDEI